MAPEMEIVFPSGSNDVRLGGVGQYRLTITTKTGVIYAPFEFEAIMPNSTGSTDVSICSMSTHFVGRNLPCAVDVYLDNMVTYTSQ